MTSPLRSRASDKEIEPLTNGTERTSVPVGHWKDSLWDIFRYGYCHCSVLNSCCCVPVAAGQVITRLQLTWTGQSPLSVSTSSHYAASLAGAAFKRLLYLTCGFWVTRTFLLIIIAILDPNIDSSEWVEPPTSYYFFAAVDDLLWFVYFAFSVILLVNLRQYVRSKYAIPDGRTCPFGCEDVCCSLFCPCLVVAQMMRHTADYDSHGGRCCTNTGLSSNAPSIV